MTQTLEEVALAFCREVLGWKRPEPSGRPCVELMDLSESTARFFLFTDLNAVMDAVQRWHKSLDEEAARQITEWLTHRFWGWLTAHHNSEWLIAALLSACVVAQRKIKGEV